jgi:SpoVK/Ycf46/Vps4 family AAA+-type ATPase
MTTKPPDKSSKNKLEHIKDISKSLLLIKWHNNKVFNPYILSLQQSKKKNNINQDNSNNELIHTQRNIKTTDNTLNMTINSILDTLEKNRKQNKRNTDFENFTKTLDDNSNNKLVKYIPYNGIYRPENIYNNNLETKSSLFTYKSDVFSMTNRQKRRSIYYPRPPPFMLSQLPLLPPLHPPPTFEKKMVNIQVEIEGLDDLLQLIEDYPLKFDVEYNINMESIHNIKEPLIELKNMIGMHKLKNSIVDQILYFIQEFHKVSNTKNNDFMHTVIYGPPGTGKTETAKIIGKIFSRLGILSKKYFKKVTRADLIAGYLGQTAIKTRDVIKEAKGGVLFIDEAYALGNPEKRDSFAKECIDTLCEGLSDNKDDLMVIIAGYEEELKNCFFSYNQGLDSRFTWRFNTDDYKYDELFLIFQKKVKDIGWKLNDKVTKTWFIDKMDYFKFFGRDIETLLAKIKIAHGRRVFCLSKEKKLTITLKDVNKGFEMFIDNNEVKSRKDSSIKDILNHMYV